MRRIAIMSDGWGRKNTYTRCQGLYDRAKELDEEIAIHRFNCYGTWRHDRKYNYGEYNIFNLPELDKYDAVVIECNNTADAGIVDKIYARCRTLNVPVIDLTRNTGEFYYVGLDNKDAIIQNVEHLYNVHQCRSFVFAGGPKYNFENQCRESGFIEAMKSHDIPVEDKMILDGSWDMICGKDAFHKIMDSWEKFPDAVVCANDSIAAGLCDEAEQNGMRIPHDFKVTGFDNADIATFFQPQISTMKHNFVQIGRVAMDIIDSLWKGQECEKMTLLQSMIMPAESCGCPGRGFIDNRRFMRRLVISNQEEGYISEKMALYEASIADCKDYESVFMNVSEFVINMGCEGFYIVIDDRLFTSIVEEDFEKNGYARERLTVGYAIEGDTIIRFPTFSQFEKHIDKYGNDAVYVYTPIHFRNKTVGYTVIKNTSFVKEDSTFFNIQSIFTRKLEELYNHAIITSVNKRLEAVYNKDPLTGLYNRIAYTQYMAPKYEEYRKDNRVCAITFFDVDDFKTINDTQGHKYGDELLRSIAAVLESNKPENGIAYRFGGDEFVVFFPDATREKIYQFQKDVEWELEQCGINISMGGVLLDPLSDISLDEYMILADEKMYAVKSAKKHEQS